MFSGKNMVDQPRDFLLACLMCLSSLICSIFSFLLCSASSKDSPQSKIIRFTLGQKKISRLAVSSVSSKAWFKPSPLFPLPPCWLSSLSTPLPAPCLQLPKPKHALATDSAGGVPRVGLGGNVCMCVRSFVCAEVTGSDWMFTLYRFYLVMRNLFIGRGEFPGSYKLSYSECICSLLHPCPDPHLLSVCCALAMVMVARLLTGGVGVLVS